MHIKKSLFGYLRSLISMNSNSSLLAFTWCFCFRRLWRPNATLLTISTSWLGNAFEKTNFWHKFYFHCTFLAPFVHVDFRDDFAILSIGGGIVWLAIVVLLIGNCCFLWVSVDFPQCEFCLAIPAFDPIFFDVILFSYFTGFVDLFCSAGFIWFSVWKVRKQLRFLLQHRWILHFEQ